MHRFDGWAEKSQFLAWITSRTLEKIVRDAPAGRN